MIVKSTALGPFQDSSRDLVEGEDFVDRSGLDRSFGHAEYSGRLLRFRYGVTSFSLDLVDPPGPVITHARQYDADGLFAEGARDGLE